MSERLSEHVGGCNPGCDPPDHLLHADRPHHVVLNGAVYQRGSAVYELTVHLGDAQAERDAWRERALSLAIRTALAPVADAGRERPYCLRCEVPIYQDDQGVWRREATGVADCPRNPAGDGHEPLADAGRTQRDSEGDAPRFRAEAILTARLADVRDLADHGTDRADEPFAWEACGFQWAWEGRDEHIHKCRHDSGHPGRHVCRCRSWQLRSAVREEAQGVRAALAPRPSAHTPQDAAAAGGEGCE
jgi:hypothetical protein